MQTQAYIGGKWRTCERRFEVTNPVDGAQVAVVEDADVQDMRDAIGAAHEAFGPWRARTAEQRAQPLRALAASMMQRQEALASLLCAEQGKPLAEARGEIAYAAGFLSWAAEEGKRLYGESIPSSKANKRLWVHREPVGVVAAITPWNFPSAMITRKIGPALAAGCTVVVKPAEQTPLSALALAQLADELDFPPGVINVVPSAAPEAMGRCITGDARVRKITFTGSTEVGKWLVEHAAQHLPRLSLELGGHAPAIVFDDASLDLAVREIVAAKFRNAGQTCVCVNRIYVQAGIAAAFTEKLRAAMDALVVGAGDAVGTDVGPLIDADALAKVRAHVADAQSKGARVRLGGDAMPAIGANFFAPTLLESCTPDMRVMREETFGPVAAVQVFETQAQAIKLANDSPYGLAAYFFSRDAARCHRVSEALAYGIVGVNDGRPSTVEAPFGGYKESGWGREGGKYAMDAYLETKFVSWNLDE